MNCLLSAMILQVIVGMVGLDMSEWVRYKMFSEFTNFWNKPIL
jgi:hypothetical protein